MAENYFKRNPKDGAIGRLRKRSDIWTSGVTHHLASTRYPAWVKVTATGGSCGKTSTFEIGAGSEIFAERYAKFKHEPTLERMSIRYGGDYGLNLELELTIKAFNRSDFEEIEAALLVPGSTIDLSFGYTNAIESKATSGYKKSTSEKNFKTTSFAVETTENGGWICTCKASAPAQFIRTVEVKSGLPNKLGNLKYIITGWFSDTDDADVTGIPELMAYDAQSSGEQSVDKFEDGTVLPVANDGGHVVIYSGDLAGVKWGVTKWFMRGWKAGDEANSENAYNKVYFTLKYVINRLVNQAMLQTAKESASEKDQDDINKLKVVIKDTDVTKIPNLISSGDPTRILILGEGFAKFKAKGMDTRDFYDLLDDKESVKSATYSKNASEIQYGNILIAQSVIEDALSDSTIEQAEENSSDNVNVKETDSNGINLEKFLAKIFNVIKEVTGGAINLGLSVDDEDKTKSTLRVLDRNFGEADSLKCIVLDPINHDGTTRDCSISSNVGSQQYQAYMFTGGSGEKDAVTHLRDCQGPENDSGERLKLYQKASSDIEELTGLKGKTGTLLKSKFSPTQTESLIGAFKTIYNNVDVIHKDHKKQFRMMPYMGVEMTATLDGIWGIIPGNAFTTTQLPNKYRKNGGYFMIRSVEHTIENSDWSTNVSGILTYHNNLEFITL